MKKDDESDDGCEIKNTLPTKLGAFILGKIQGIINNFIREINGFFKNNIHLGDIDSLFIEKKHPYVLD